jgi:hypothetical protein
MNAFLAEKTDGASDQLGSKIPGRPWVEVEILAGLQMISPSNDTHDMLIASHFYQCPQLSTHYN